MREVEILKKKQLKCYLYTRVSTSMQVDGYSLDAQRDKLRKYAAYEDMIVAGEYSDEGFSGKNIQGRQEFQRMLNDIQDGKDDVSYVLVFKLSRFGRNAADVLNSLQLMQDFGVNLICVEDGIDSSKDAGKLMISVLSAVAEIERENIRTQTMAGREQKAREGKWNGGFAPYGYKLENGNLVIAEDEVEVIRVIYDRYIHTNEGVAGVAKYLNRNGYTKKLRQNNTIPGFSRDFVKNVLYNPVYMGKIAYGRRRTEKKQGTRNEMHVVEQSEFPVYEGQHEAIISEEDWYLAQEKRKINSFKREKVNNPDHAHILSGILKCPCCGKSMYGNIAKAHSKDKKTRYYYYCKNTVTPTGHECSFRLNIEQTEINKFVAKVISAMVNNPRFVEAIQAKIGTAVDTEDMERQIAVLQGRLKQAFGTKSRLERQMDTLDINDAHYDRKILDLQRRYDEQYDTIEEIEVQIGELQSQIRSIQQEKISGDNIYRLLLAFDEVYHSATEAEQKEFMKAFIERIEMFPEKRKDGSWIKKIVFNFPVPVDGEEVKELPLETETTVDLVPGVVAVAGVALGQGAGDVLAAAHGGKQRGKVIADALGAAEGRGGAGDVALHLAGGDPVGQGLVVGVAAGDEVVDGHDLLLVGLGVLAQLGGLGRHGVAGGEGDFTGGDQVGGVGAVDGHAHGLAGHDPVGGAGEVLADADGVGAVALVQGEGGGAAGAVAVGGLAAAVLDADLQAGGGGVAHGHIARAGVGDINDLGPGSPSHGDQGQEREGCEQNADITKQPLHNSDLLSVTGCQPRTGDPVFCGGKAL